MFLVDKDAKQLVMKVQQGLPESIKEGCGHLPFGRCLCGLAAQEGKVIFAGKIDHRHEHTFTDMMPHGHYCVPLQSAGKMLGVLNLYVPDGHRRTEDEEQFLTAVADTMAGVIQRWQAEELLKESLERLEDFDQYSTEGVCRVDITKPAPIDLPRTELLAWINKHAGGPVTDSTVRKMIARAGRLAGFRFTVNPHMLRHACGYKLANDGVDTRTLQAYLGHANIQNTVRYTKLSAARFNALWKD